MKTVNPGNHAVIRVASNDVIVFKNDSKGTPGPRPDNDPSRYIMEWKRDRTSFPRILMAMYKDHLYSKYNIPKDNIKESFRLEDLAKHDISADDMYFSVTLPYDSEYLYEKGSPVKLWSGYADNHDRSDQNLEYIAKHCQVDYTENIEAKWARDFILPAKCYRHSGTVTLTAQIGDLRYAQFYERIGDNWFAL